MNSTIKTGLALLLMSVLLVSHSNAAVRLKELVRVEGVRDNPLMGYGIVVGLAGSGDTSRSKATLHSISNALQQFGVIVSEDQIRSRNVAAVMVTATLPAFTSVGTELDISVSSMGDARSLVGGTLLMTPLKAANDKTYALAQGQVSVGGFKYDVNGNLLQKNHPTVGRIPGGAVVEKSTTTSLEKDGKIVLVLHRPDFTTADRVSRVLESEFPGLSAEPLHAGKIEMTLTENQNPIRVISKIEGLLVEPDRVAVVVINERTGTVVSGGDVKLQNITISHDNLKVIVSTDFLVSQPSFVRQTGAGVASVVVPDTELDVKESIAQAVDLPSGASIADLISALRKIKTSTRDVIVILQAIKTAGALNAELVIQ
ncbi:flagellar biosynthesis protein FlgI [Gammaproteobacteria bacterium 45_16_T64]|nr:flagellar biosynthesis protein FlgI [Gammaproteobacteria bacterium 45_16_T64]